jgi:hypothetical protein
MKPMKKNPPLIKFEPGFPSRILLVLVVIGLVAFTMWVSGPVPPKDQPLIITETPTPTLNPLSTLQAATAVQPLIEKTPTSGVLVGTLIIVLIVLIGTMVTVWQLWDRSTLKHK